MAFYENKHLVYLQATKQMQIKYSEKKDLQTGDKWFVYFKVSITSSYEERHATQQRAFDCAF